jgi:hypothetical protein
MSSDAPPGQHRLPQKVVAIPIAKLAVLQVVYVIHHGIFGKGYARNMNISEWRNEFLGHLTEMRGPPF